MKDRKTWVLSKKRFGCFLGHLTIWVSGVESPLIFYTKKKREKKYNLHAQNTSTIID